MQASHAAFRVAVFLLFSVSAAAAPPKIDFPPLEFDPPKPERRVLTNGVVVYLLEDDELPLFELDLRMRTSPGDMDRSLWPAKDLFGTVWRTGGTKQRPPDELNRELETLPAKVETGAGEEMFQISLSCLSWDIEKGLDLFADVLFNPIFNASQLELAKQNALEAELRENETPASISGRAFRDVLYGDDHAYSWNLTPTRIKSVSRRQLRDIHRRFIAPDDAMAVVWGDFDEEAILASLERIFKDWRPSGRKTAGYDYDEIGGVSDPVVYVEKDFSQSRIYIGGLGIRRHHPDQYALAVANEILGSGGGSRLFGEIRSRLGLAYVVGSFYTKPVGPGLVGAASQTKAESTIETIQAMQRVLDNFVANPTTEEELDAAKDSIINAFVFQFESTESIVHEQASLEFFGYEPDFLERYPERIQAVTADDVARVAKRYFSPENRTILVVGPQSRFEGDLGEFGDVKSIPLAEIE